MIKNILMRRKENDTYLADEGRSAGWKLQYFIIFHHDPRTPTMSTDSSQIGVALFPSH